MELRHLRYFLAVAEAENFTRAAETLGIGQPPLSQQIKQLETALGVRLFRRTAHGAVLTDAGHAFAPEAMRVLDGMQHAIEVAQRAGRGETGKLRIGFTSSAAFNPIVSGTIRQFRKAYPDAELTLVEANTLPLLQGLEESRLDAIFIRPGSATPAGMTLHRFADETMQIVVPSEHPFAARLQLRIADLAAEPFVLFPRAVGMSLYDEVFNACVAAGFSPMLAQEAPQISSVINLVAAGLGVSIVPAAVTKVRVDGVRYLPIEGPAPLAKLALAVKTADRQRADEQRPLIDNFLRLLETPPSKDEALQ